MNEQLIYLKRSLRCELTPEETNVLARQAARATADAEEREVTRKEADAQFKAEIKSFQATASAAHRKINNGYEYRDVECSKTYDVVHNRVVITRTDTGAVIEDRAMTVQERQGDLPLETAAPETQEDGEAEANNRAPAKGRGRRKRKGEMTEAAPEGTNGSGEVQSTHFDRENVQAEGEPAPMPEAGA